MLFLLSFLLARASSDVNIPGKPIIHPRPPIRRPVINAQIPKNIMCREKSVFIMKNCMYVDQATCLKKAQESGDKVLEQIVKYQFATITNQFRQYIDSREPRFICYDPVL